jgi:4-hydroxy-tetrahydrodipicolinate synthase
MNQNAGFVIDGIVPVIPTPFHEDEGIAWESLAPMIAFARAAGAAAVCLPAYASEFYKLGEQERLRLIGEAVRAANGAIPVVAQVNAPSLGLALKMAKAAADLGASAIATAVPRLFAIPEEDLFEYFDRMLKQVDLPVIIQDFNPGGATVSVAFVERLHRARRHFQYLKLEEPMMAGKAMAVHEATGGGVKVLEGWGGMYLLDLAPTGIAGVVPGLGPVDLLERVYRLAKAGKREEACPAFEAVLPQIVYSLQSLELYHHAEKRLLQARGVLDTVVVRRPRITLSDHEAAHIDFINRRILDMLDEFGLPRNPAA